MPTWKASNCVFHTNQREYGRFCQRRKHSKPQTCGKSEVLTLLFKFPTFSFRCYSSLDRKCSPLPFMSKVTHIHQMRSISFIFCHILQAAIRLVFDQGVLGPDVNGNSTRRVRSFRRTLSQICQPRIPVFYTL